MSLTSYRTAPPREGQMTEIREPALGLDPRDREHGAERMGGGLAGCEASGEARLTARRASPSPVGADLVLTSDPRVKPEGRPSVVCGPGGGRLGGWLDLAVTRSPTLKRAVPWAQRSFTAEFGMGSGGASAL